VGKLDGMVIGQAKPMMLREAVGEALHEVRRARGLTLRETATGALISVGYLSELERGRKEASSELLNSVCMALRIAPSDLLYLAADRLQAGRHDNVVPLRPQIQLDQRAA
jgi:transcriptional regulator with XRE-family HTH domain